MRWKCQIVNACSQVKFRLLEIWNRACHRLHLQTGSQDVPLVQTGLHLLLLQPVLLLHLRLFLRLLLRVNLHILAEDTKEKSVRNDRQEKVLCSSEALNPSCLLECLLSCCQYKHLLTVTILTGFLLMMTMPMMATGDFHNLAFVINMVSRRLFQRTIFETNKDYIKARM